MLTNKTCLITGATNGIGLATARELARQGATVVGVGRSPARCAAAEADLRRQTGQTNIAFLVADLSSLAEVRRLAAEVLARYPRLDVLINNAGGVFQKRQLTVDGLEMTFALNHLAPFLLTNLLTERLLASAPARVVTVSSGAHAGLARLDFDNLQGERSYSSFGAYSLSKLANILFSNELARRLAGQGVTSNALHPGFVNSGFGQDLPMMRFAAPLLKLFSVSPEQGARTSLYLAAAAEAASVSGRYFNDKAQAVDPSPGARDPQAARKLWEVSEALTAMQAQAARS